MQKPAQVGLQVGGLSVRVRTPRKAFWKAQMAPLLLRPPGAVGRPPGWETARPLLGLQGARSGRRCAPLHPSPWLDGTPGGWALSEVCAALACWPRHPWLLAFPSLVPVCVVSTDSAELFNKQA